MTVHWIDADTLQRQYAYPSLCVLMAVDVLASEMDDVHTEYDI